MDSFLELKLITLNSDIDSLLSHTMNQLKTWRNCNFPVKKPTWLLFVFHSGLLRRNPLAHRDVHFLPKTHGPSPVTPLWASCSFVRSHIQLWLAPSQCPQVQLIPCCLIFAGSSRHTCRFCSHEMCSVYFLRPKGRRHVGTHAGQ